MLISKVWKTGEIPVVLMRTCKLKIVTVTLRVEMFCNRKASFGSQRSEGRMYYDIALPMNYITVPYTVLMQASVYNVNILGPAKGRHYYEQN